MAVATALPSTPHQPSPAHRRERRLSTSIKADLGLAVVDRQNVRRKSLPASAFHEQASFFDPAKKSALSDMCSRRRTENVPQSAEGQRASRLSESRAVSAQSRHRLGGEQTTELPHFLSERTPVNNDCDCVELISCHSSESVDEPSREGQLQTTADTAEDADGADEASAGMTGASATVLRAPTRTVSRTKEQLDAEFDRLFDSMKQSSASRAATPRLTPVDGPASARTYHRGRRESYADTILKQEIGRNTLEAAAAVAAAYHEKEKERRDIIGERIETSAYHGLEVVQAKLKEVEALVHSTSNMGSEPARKGKPRKTR